MTPIHRLFRCGFPALLLTACGDDSSAPTLQDEVQVDLSLACIDEAVPQDPNDDVSSEDAVSTTAVERCIFDRSEGALTVNLEGAGTISIVISGFTGTGTYTTDGEGDTILRLNELDTAGDVPGDDSPRLEATLEVTSDLTAGGTETSGFVTIDVSATQVGASAIGRVTCDVSPASFSITVAECEAQE